MSVTNFDIKRAIHEFKIDKTLLKNLTMFGVNINAMHITNIDIITNRIIFYYDYNNHFENDAHYYVIEFDLMGIYRRWLNLLYCKKKYTYTYLPRKNKHSPYDIIIRFRVDFSEITIFKYNHAKDFRLECEITTELDLIMMKSLTISSQVKHCTIASSNHNDDEDTIILVTERSDIIIYDCIHNIFSNINISHELIKYAYCDERVIVMTYDSGLIIVLSITDLCYDVSNINIEKAILLTKILSPNPFFNDHDRQSIIGLSSDNHTLYISSDYPIDCLHIWSIIDEPFKIICCDNYFADLDYDDEMYVQPMHIGFAYIPMIDKIFSCNEIEVNTLSIKKRKKNICQFKMIVQHMCKISDNGEIMLSLVNESNDYEIKILAFENYWKQSTHIFYNPNSRKSILTLLLMTLYQKFPYYCDSLPIELWYLIFKFIA